MSGVQTLAISPNNNQIVLSNDTSGNYVITNSIPVYNGSAYGGIEKLNTTQPGDTIGTQELRVNYNNLDVSTGLLIQTTTNPPPPGSTQTYNTYTLSANLAGVEAGNGINITDDIGNVKIINTDIVGFTGPLSTGPGGQEYGITFSDPDENGIVTVIPTVCGINAGVGIGVSNPSVVTPNVLTVRATVADITEGNGIQVLSDPLTGTYQVAATVGDILAGPGIALTYGQGGTYEVDLNLSQPTLSGIDTQINNVGDYTLKATYQNLTTTTPGLTITRSAGNMITPPSANLVANVSSLAATGTGITTSQNTGTNEWTINNTGILSVVGGQNISVDITSGVATVTYDASSTLGDELVLSGSLQVPTVIGGRTQGTHFDQYHLNIPSFGPVHNIQPSPTQQGDCIISYGNVDYGYISYVSGGLVTSTFTQQPGIQDFVYMSTNQQSTLSPLGAGWVTSFSFMKTANGVPGNPFFRTAGVICQGDQFDPRTFWTDFNNANPLAATGMATSGINMYSIITTPGFGIYIAPPPLSGSVAGSQNKNACSPLVTTGSYGNPVITRQYNKVNDNIVNAGRARCFCTLEQGGLVEIPFSVEAPYFGQPINIPNSPIGIGWLPLTVVPLEDQWTVPSGTILTTKFNYLVYLSNGLTTSVYNTSTQQWQSLPVNGYVSSFYNSRVISVAPPEDTIYSQFYGGSFLRSDLSPDSQGNYPEFGARSQTSSLFFPIPLNYNDCIMFSSWVLDATEVAVLYQSTFTPDLSEYVGNSIQVKALDFLQLQTDGVCQINSTNLMLDTIGIAEINNTGTYITSDDVSISTQSFDVVSTEVSINSAGIGSTCDMNLNGVQLVADSSSSVDLSSVNTLTLPSGTLYTPPIPSIYLTNAITQPFFQYGISAIPPLTPNGLSNFCRLVINLPYAYPQPIVNTVQVFASLLFGQLVSPAPPSPQLPPAVTTDQLFSYTYNPIIVGNQPPNSFMSVQIYCYFHPSVNLQSPLNKISWMVVGPSLNTNPNT